MELNYKSFGEGPEILIFHGLFGMLDNWKSFARLLSEDYKVFIIDQRDHGRSPHSDCINYHVLAEDILAFIEYHELNPIALIGHSMGGKAVMNFAELNPEREEQYIIVDISPAENRASHEKIFEAMFSFDPQLIGKRSEAQEILMAHLDDQGIVLFLMKNLSRNPNGGYEWKMNLELLHNSYSEILAGIEISDKIENQTMFIKGALSEYIDTDKESLIRSKFENVQIVEIENAGHWVHADQQSLLLDTIRRFLKQ